MILPTPRSTLFPYTSLFRSIEHEWAFKKAPGFTHGLRLDFIAIQNNLVPGYQFKFYPGYSKSKVAYKGFFVGLHPDRKSTRLNSSHPSISYAVFCLKKKTQP